MLLNATGSAPELPEEDGFMTPFADGGFGTPSGKCEFYSETLAKRGLDPLPNYVPPHEGDASENRQGVSAGAEHATCAMP